ALVARHIPSGDTLSPAGYPNRTPLGFSAKQFPLVAAALGFLALSVVVFVVLWISIRGVAGNAADRMSQDAVAARGTKVQK
ncbi:MAG TPA: hypothetical protein VLC09_02280, partial [Polyangiaceae bacterium]|nr:hypothetical protein [Polyangiaceae bacterium]